MFQTDKCGGRGKPLKNINFGKISISYLFYLPETFIFLGAFYDFIFGLEFSGHWRIFKVLQEQRSFSWCSFCAVRSDACKTKNSYFLDLPPLRVFSQSLSYSSRILNKRTSCPIITMRECHTIIYRWKYRNRLFLVTCASNTPQFYF